MANSLNTPITSTYAGEFAGKYLSAALLSANTIDKGGIEVMPNIKYKSTMKKVATASSIIGNAACDFSGTADPESQTHPTCLLYTSPSPRDGLLSRMPSSA